MLFQGKSSACILEAMDTLAASTAEQASDGGERARTHFICIQGCVACAHRRGAADPENVRPYFCNIII